MFSPLHRLPNYFVFVFLFAAFTPPALGQTAPQPALQVSTSTGATLTSGSTVDFGAGAVGTANPPTSFTILNSGSGPLNITSVSIDGGVPGEFVISTPPSSTVAAGASTSLSITFSATDSGTRTAILTLHTDDPNNDTFTLNLTGTGGTPQMIIQQPIGLALTSGSTTIDCGYTPIGGPSYSAAFYIYNAGTAPLTLSIPNTQFSGANSGEFNFVGTSFVIPVGDHYPFFIEFTPGAAGLRTASLTIAGNAPNTPTFVLNVTGTGVTPTTVNAIFQSAATVPISSNGYVAVGNSVNLTLNYAPTPGTNLTVINNTGLGFINGTFTNLAQGQAITLTYNGVTYSYIANYYGGTGNDLVLQWANVTPYAWGANSTGQLGDNNTVSVTQPALMYTTGILQGKTILSLTAGANHGLALSSDGSVAAWGKNNLGQLGVGNPTITSATTPTALYISASSPIYRKKIIAIAAGATSSVALCSDGTVCTWGDNSLGQLGNSTNAQSSAVPVAVTNTGSTAALLGKTVVSIAAGDSHILALCSDGTLVAWGSNSTGQLGCNSGVTYSLSPMAVNTDQGTSSLYGKTVIAIAAGASHSLALCSDGSMHAWGSNLNGQLGTNSTLITQNNAPVAVATATGGSVLAGQQITAIAAGANESYALCAPGQVAAWGSNTSGALGNSTVGARSIVPIWVDTTAGASSLSGKTVIAIAPGLSSCLALCSDGTISSWGLNSSGQLGNRNTTSSTEPVAVFGSHPFITIGSGSPSASSFALAAVAPSSPHMTVAQSGAVLTAGQSVVNFGQVALGSSSTGTLFQVSNSGTAPLNLSNVQISGVNGSDFALTGTPPSTIAWNSTLGFYVAFSPTGPGVRTAILTITSNDPTKGTFSILLTGTGTSAATTSALYFASSPQSVVGTGISETITYPPSTYFDVSYNTQNYSVILPMGDQTTTWDLWFWAPNSARLTPGTYLGATAFPYLELGPAPSTAPEMMFYRPLTQQAPSTLSGYFTVLSVSYNANGYMNSFAADFVQYDNGNAQQWNAGSVRYNSDIPLSTFTPGTPPTVVSAASSSVTGSSAVLSGSVNPNGSATTVYFQYGTDTSYGCTTAPQSISNGSTAVNISAALPSLFPGTTYHYQLIALGAQGTGGGTDGTFTTPSTPLITSATVTTASPGVFAYQITAINGPTSYSVSGLPAGLTLDSSQGTITGTVSGGNYTLTLGATNAAGSATSTLRLTVSPTPLQTWRQTYFPGSTATSGQGADTATPQNDGISNLMKFATGMNPNAPGAMPGVMHANGNMMSFSYTPSADAVAQGLSFTVEYSYSLTSSSWSSDIVNQGNIGAGGAPVTATMPAPASGSCFMHLKVTSPNGSN